MKLLIVILLIITISCSSDFDFEPNERNNRLYLDTIATYIDSSTVPVLDTIHIIVYDTIPVFSYKTIYDTIYVDTRVSIRFLYENEQQQVAGVDTIFLDSKEIITWEAKGYLVNIIQFKLE